MQGNRAHHTPAPHASYLAMVVDVVPHQLLQFGEPLASKRGFSCWRGGGAQQPQQRQPLLPHDAYSCEEVDEAAITQAVHGLIAGDEDCEGPGPLQDGR